MRGTDDIFTLDFQGVCGAVSLIRESAVGETDFVIRGVDYVSCGVAGLSVDAEQACAHFGVGGVFRRQKIKRPNRFNRVKNKDYGSRSAEGAISRSRHVVLYANIRELGFADCGLDYNIGGMVGISLG